MGELTVETAGGRLRGTRDRGVRVFRGIPFADPPVGKLRFRAPEAPSPWAGVRDATSFRPSAMQSTGMPSMLPGGYSFHHGMQPCSEDCLYLNVWTPACDGAKRPVMVWIHGGAFLGGSGDAPLYNGSVLAARGDAVIVTFNYRLGPFGFLAIDDEHGPNQAVGDWIAALSWVRENIDVFGGDPDNVTIFGESAGAIAVSTLLGVPAAKPLFQKVVAQSGGGRTVVSRERAGETAALLLSQLDLKPGMVEKLIATPAADLLNAALMVFARLQFKRDTITGGFEPCHDDVVVTGNPVDVVAAGEYRAVPMIVGSTRDEMTLTRMGDAAVLTLDDDGLDQRCAELLGSAANDVVAAYRAARRDLTPGELWERILTGREMRMPAIRLAEAQARAGGSAFNYVFTWESPTEGLGATHGIDLGFTFGTFDDLPGHDVYGGTGEAAAAFSSTVQDLWLSFARFGAPTSDASSWVPYDTTRRPTLLLGATPSLVDDPDADERAAWTQ